MPCGLIWIMLHITRHWHRDSDRRGGRSARTAAAAAAKVPACQPRRRASQRTQFKFRFKRPVNLTWSRGLSDSFAS